MDTAALVSAPESLAKGAGHLARAGRTDFSVQEMMVGAAQPAEAAANLWVGSVVSGMQLRI